MTEIKIQHKVIKGEQRPFILVRNSPVELPDFKHKGDIQYAPLRPSYRELLLSNGLLTFDELPDYTTGYAWNAPPQIKPYVHQKITTEFMIQNFRCWVLNKMRSGKTLSTIWAIHRMLCMGIIKKIVIAAPLSIMRSVWQKELHMVMPNRSVYIADESVEHLYNKLVYTDTQIVVMNHDKLRHIDETLDQWGFDLMVVDEAGAFRAVDSDRVAALQYTLMDTHQTSHRKDRRFIALTATPVPQSPMDIWSLGRIINRDLFPPSMTEYRDRVMHAVRIPKHKNKPLPPPGTPAHRRATVTVHKPKSGVDNYIRSLIQPAILFRTEDCLDMPRLGYTTRPITYTSAQARALKAMEKDHTALIKDLESGLLEEVVAANAAVAVSKYLQICGGVIIDNNGDKKIVGASQRLKAITEIADEIGPDEKFIVFCMFTNVQNYIEKGLLKHGINSLFLRGSMTGRERNASVTKFMEDDVHRCIIVHPEVGKYGLNLSRANTKIWYTPVFSCDQYVQANARFMSPLKEGIPEEDQAKTIVRLSGGPKEDDLYDRLLSKEARQDNIIETFRRLVTDADVLHHAA